MNQISNVKGLKFVHMNTRSIYRRIDEIRLLYSNFDFICCSETWLDDSYNNVLLNIDHMRLFRLDRVSNAAGRYRYNCGGGVCIFVSVKWISYCDRFLEGTMTCFDFEILTLKFNKPNFKTFFISVVYKPPRGDSAKLMKFISDFVDRNPSHEYWILGDFNIDFLKRNLPSTREAVICIRNMGFVQLIKNCTRPSAGKGTCIDWIITNSEYVSMSYVSNDLITDHYPIVCVRKKARELKYKVPKFIRLYNKLDLRTLDNLLNDIDWDEYTNDPNPNTKWDFIKDKVSRIIEIMCPLKKIFVRKTQPPWFDNSISKLIKDRVVLSRLFRNTGDSEVLRELKIVRNKVTEAVRRAHDTYINISLSRNRNNPRKFWRIINSFYTSKENSRYDGHFFDPDTGVVVPTDSISIFLNDYFANIGTKLNSLDDTITDDIEGMFPEMSNFTFNFPMIDRFDILFLAKEIDVHKSSCIPSMRSDVCKYLFEILPDRIADLYNSSLTSGIYPTEWSLGYVNLIPKPGLLSSPSNWRPITQTNIFGKNLENLVQRALLRYFLEHGVLTDRQYGFLPGRSTHEAIFDLSRHIFSSINNKKLMGLLFLDISKAFDCILHGRLLKKLQLVGCSPDVISWFKSYLTRTQIVTYNDIESTTSTVPTGIGQGTILGPLIFIFYMNDIVDHMMSVKISMYADDCVLYLSGNNWENIKGKIQDDLDCFEHWGLLNNLHLNVKKTKMLVVGPTVKLKKLHDISPLCVYGNNIDFVKQYNYLGVILDSEMNMRHFFNHVKKLVHSILFVFRKIRSFLSEHAAIMLYKHMILPFMEYAGFMLLSCNIDDRKELQRWQNDALRLCTLCRLSDRIRIPDLHARCKIISLEQRRRIQLLLLMYKKVRIVVFIRSLLEIPVPVIELFLRRISMKELCINIVRIFLVLRCGMSYLLTLLNFLIFFRLKRDLKA